MNLSKIASRIVGLTLEEIKAHPVHGKRYQEISDEIGRMDEEINKLSRILEWRGMDALDEEGNRIDDQAYALQNARNKLTDEVRAMHKIKE